jgi:hypothetical protein
MAPAQKSEAAIKEELEQVLQKIETLKQNAQEQGAAFESLTEEQLIQKLRGETSESPFFFFTAWDQFSHPGGRSYHLANYWNPDPDPKTLSVTMFVGLGVFDPEISSAIMMRDTRWPSVSTRRAFLANGEVGEALFSFPVPLATKGTYFGTVLLWGAPAFNFGQTPTVFDHRRFDVTLR